jgi:hypothetical protein
MHFPFAVFPSRRNDTHIHLRAGESVELLDNRKACRPAAAVLD